MDKVVNSHLNPSSMRLSRSNIEKNELINGALKYSNYQSKDNFGV